MLVLFETSAGFALFKVLQEGKLKETTDLWQDFSSLETAQSVRLALRTTVSPPQLAVSGSSRWADHGMRRS